MGTPSEAVPLPNAIESKIPNKTSDYNNEAPTINEEQSIASSIFDPVQFISKIEYDNKNSSAQENIICAQSSVFKIEVERSSSPLSQIQIMNSSPLTSVQDLNEDSRDSILLSESKKNEDDSSMNSQDNSSSKDLLKNDLELNVDGVQKYHVYQFQNIVTYTKENPNSSAASKPDDTPSISTYSKKVGASEDSGTTAPFDCEEGLLLPGRKKPVLSSQINSKDRAGRTFIFKFASNGDYSVTEALLKAGASLRIVDNAGWTPLHEACLNGHEDIVELLLSYDADVDAPGGDGDTPLHDAIGNGHLGVINRLLKHGASLDLHNELHQTPEEFAIEKYETLKIETKNDSSLLQDCETAKKIVELLKNWRNMTEQVVKRNNDGQTILHLACTTGQEEEVRKMLDYGADINATDNSGWTPIHNAALHGHSEIVFLLLRYGSDVEPLGLRDETPLHDAAANGHTMCASLLLQYGSDPSRKNINDKMPIDLIPEGNEALKELLSRPVDLWQPIKKPEYYPKVLESGFAQKGLKREDSKIGKVVKREIPQHWEGLEARGSFESSREEKKFQALLKTLSRTNNSEKDPLVSDEKLKPIIRQPNASSESTAITDNLDSINSKFAGKKKQQNPIEPPPKRPKMNSLVKESPISLPSAQEKSSSSVQSKKSENKPAVDNAKSQPGTASIDLKKPSKTKQSEKAAPISKLHLALAEASREVESLSFAKKKKRFMISGYQAVGESSTEVSSESLGQSNQNETPNLPLLSINDSIPSSTELLKNISIFQSHDTSSEIGKSTNDPTNQFKNEKIDESKRTEIEKKHCLPLVAYLKPQNGAIFFKPINITREGLWGNLPKNNHTKVFIDMQIAFCLGLKNGRELLEKYPSLESRVATTVEKTALEKTIVSHRLFMNMLLTMDPNWIPTITVNQQKSLKMADVDVHLIFWNESLFRILSNHIEDVEKISSCSLSWLEDLEWPAPPTAEPVENEALKIKKFLFED